MPTKSSTTPTAEISVAKQTEVASGPQWDARKWIREEEISTVLSKRHHKERKIGALGYRFPIDHEFSVPELLDLIPTKLFSGGSASFKLYVSALVRCSEDERRLIEADRVHTNSRKYEDLEWCADDAIEDIYRFVGSAEAALACAKEFSGERILGGIYKELLDEFHEMHVDEECHRVGTAMNAIHGWASKCCGWGKDGWVGDFRRRWNEWEARR